MAVIGKLFLLNVLGKDVWVSQTPRYRVVRFITKAQRDSYANGMMNKFVVTEGLPSPSGMVIVHYIKA